MEAAGLSVTLSMVEGQLIELKNSHPQTLRALLEDRDWVLKTVAVLKERIEGFEAATANYGRRFKEACNG